MTIFGTRPEIIRLSLVIKLLDEHCDHVTVHTGQNFDESLSDIFLRDLEVRTPDVHLGIRATGFGDQVGQILTKMDAVITEHEPDKILILGDTNSALAAFIAARKGVPVFHMEAGNRCFDDRVPEEINRRVIDHSSTVLMPYTTRSKENLVREGIERDRIFVTGNPINEVLESFAPQILSSRALADFSVAPREYFLVTLHRAENVDGEARLRRIFDGFTAVAEKYGKPILVSVHPRTAEKLENFGIKASHSITLLKPLGFFDFIKLEQNALAVLTDSGTVQEECCIFGVPNVTIRDVTERPETIECGSNVISGAQTDSILRTLKIALSTPADWTPPEEYRAKNVSTVVAKIILGYTSSRKHVS